ncbi:hypothetical protein AMTRI_Chr04g250070 [Amborella trichopoda]
MGKSLVVFDYILCSLFHKWAINGYPFQWAINGYPFLSLSLSLLFLDLLLIMEGTGHGDIISSLYRGGALTRDCNWHLLV